MAATEEMPVQSLTMAVPIRSRKYEDVVKGVARIVARMRALHIPLNRIHTDRGQEFCSKEFQKWIQSRDLWHTTTAGDEPSSNARAENHLKLLQGRTRTLMKTAKCDVTYWPLALRYASEEKFRSQLRACGVPAPAMIPFGVKAYAKKKQWQDKHQMWRTPMTAVRVWGPAYDMSMTSKGYFMETVETGTFMRSTVVVVPKQAPAISDEQQALGEASSNGNVEAQVPKPAEDDDALLYSPSIGPDDEVAPPDLLEDDTDRGEVELELETPTHTDRGIATHDPPRRRLNGKQAAPLYDAREFPPTLRQIQVGGECQGESAQGESAQQAQQEAKAQQQRRRWQNKQEDLMLMEHEGMLNWVKEERCIARDPGTLHTVLSVEAEIGRLEKTLEEQARISKIELEEEVLQTRVVPPEEVRQDMEGWKPVFQKEYDMLRAGPITPIFEEEMRELEEKQVPMEVLPAKAIASKKPPNRRKGRVVVCGNFTEDRDGQDISVGGVCAMAVRGVVHAAACKKWTIGSIDVAGAFLQAPRREKSTLTVVQPPRLLQQLNITKPNEKWRVNCALYGFVESPADWANHRNQSMESMTWEDEAHQFWLERTPEQHLWKVKKQKKDGSVEESQTAGWVAVYVDDFLVAMHDTEIAGIFQAIKATWKCSEEEYVRSDKGMRFCGYEIRARESGGFEMTQEGYIKDLIARYQVERTETSATPKIEDDEDEESPKPSVIREAQGLCGELLWVAGRTRPDVAYGVGLMSRLIHRRPSLVVELGYHMLRYLKGTPQLGLVYKPVAPEERDTINVLADTSFAPPHEKFRSVQAVVIEHGPNVLAWETSRQAFITQSTAEAELVGYNEAFQIGQATAALLEVLELAVKVKKLQGDCKAGLAQLTGDTGPWRTRHLRLRSAKLREELRDQKSGWSAEHKPGVELVADGLTKSLQGAAFQRFVGMLKMKTERKEFAGNGEPKVAKLSVSPNHGLLMKACAVVGVALLRDDIVTACILLVAAFVLREVVGRNQKDPAQDRKRIPKKKCGGQGDTPYGYDRSGTVTPNCAGPGIPHVGDPWDQVGVDGRVGELTHTPKVCALRFPSRSHGKPQDDKPRGVAQRGRAAMELIDSRTQVAGSTVGGDSQASSANGPEVGSEGGHSVLEGLQSMRELQAALEELEGAEMRENLHQSGDDSHSSQSAPAQVSTTASRGVPDRRQEDQQPWNQREFQAIGRSSRDSWNMTLRDQGWIVREHRKPRVRAFHPVHASTPMDCAELRSHRVTKKVWPHEQLVMDQWTRANHWTGEPWMGYTFFQIKNNDDDDDGSFELVGP